MFRQSQAVVNQASAVRPAKPSSSAPVHRSVSHPRMGNQAAQRLLQEGVIQAKLMVNRPGDRFEQEADRVADQVMRMPVVSGATVAESAQRLSIQRLCAECEEEVQRQPMEDKVSVMPIQTQPEAGHTPAVTTAIQAQVEALRSGGQRLSTSTRAFFEPRFGHDFGHVRLHADAQAATSARALGAQAYTVGRDIVFGAGQYAPHTTDGQRLLAHELTHTVQQGQQSTVSQGWGMADHSPVAQQRGGTPGQLWLQRQPTTPGGAASLCEKSKCSDGDLKVIAGDLTEALAYVNKALLALRDPAALSDATRQALDWFFGSQAPATVQTIKERLGFIQHCLQDTQKNESFGCDPDETGEAYTDVPESHPLGQLFPTNICLTPSHLNSGDARQRATTMLHECGHRMGLTLTKGSDIYSDRTAFRYLDTARALRITESYAEFAAAIAKGVKTSLVSTLGLSFGQAFLPGSSNAWLGRLYFNVELQHPRNKLPVVSWVNPSLGLGVTLIGEATTGGASPLSLDKSLLATLALGVRFGDPRPGSSHRVSLSIFGGPGLSTKLVSSFTPWREVCQSIFHKFVICC
ncbi:MAG: DUF4157 domain-containing protein [Deltaproteobacteria bacterium]|nr:DUF4157 domain-containing protein [Deltaproteobacteria bacterium]